MKILYADNGFEQDNEPQLCIEATCLEIEHLITIIKIGIENYVSTKAIILDIPFLNKNGIQLTMDIKKNGNYLIKQIDDVSYSMSLDIQLWAKIIELIKPLTRITGYQFIEISEPQKIVEDVGLIFRSI